MLPEEVAVPSTPAASPAEASAPAAAVGPNAPPAAPAEPAKPKARDLAALGQQQARLRRERRALLEREAQWARERSELNTALQRALAGLQEGARFRSELEAVRADPLGWAEKNGVDPNEAVKKAIARGTPEAEIAAAKQEIAREREARLELEKRLAKEREEAGARSVQVQEAQALRAFVGHVTANGKDYPHLNVLLSPQEIGAKAQEIHAWAKSEGHTYSLTEVAQFLERQAKVSYERIEAQREKLMSPPATTVAAPQVPPPAQKKAAPASAPRDTEGAKDRGPRARQRMQRAEEQKRAAEIAELKRALALDAQPTKA